MDSKQFSGLLDSIHVPGRYRNVDRKSLYFSNFSQERPFSSKEKISIRSHTQEEWFDKLNQSLVNNKSVVGYKGTLLCISSNPTDFMAMSVGFYPVVSLLKHVPMLDIQIFNLGFKYKEPESIPEILVLHTVSMDSSYEFIDNARRWIRWTEDKSFILLIASGTNPINFCDNKLRIAPDAVLYSEGQPMVREY